MNELRFNCNVDLVLCIDATGSMSPILDMVKDSASSFYEKIEAALQEKKRMVEQFRIKVIVFRDYYCDGKAAMQVSEFFELPSQTSEFKSFIYDVEANGGGDEPENALEAIALAMNSDWVQDGQRKRHIIMMWTDASAHPLEKEGKPSIYPTDIPQSFVELTDWWTDGQKMNKSAQRLILFSPDAYPWNEIAANWTNVVHVPSKAGEGLEEIDMDLVLSCIAGSI